MLAGPSVKLPEELGAEGDPWCCWEPGRAEKPKGSLMMGSELFI